MSVQKQTTMQKTTISPEVKTSFQPGAILCATWGHEQTNVDFYCILERSGDWVAIIKMKVDEVSEGPLTMSSKVKPTEVDWNAKAFRKKVKSFRGEESGFPLENGWATLWNGKEKYASHYA